MKWIAQSFYTTNYMDRVSCCHFSNLRFCRQPYDSIWRKYSLQTQGQASLKPWIYHINKSQSEKNIYRCPLVTDVYTFCRGNWNSVLLFWQCLLNYFNYSSIYHGLFNLHLLCFLPLFTNKYYLISDFVIKNGTGGDPREKVRFLGIWS